MIFSHKSYSNNVNKLYFTEFSKQCHTLGHRLDRDLNLTLSMMLTLLYLAVGRHISFLEICHSGEIQEQLIRVTTKKYTGDPINALEL